MLPEVEVTEVATTSVGSAVVVPTAAVGEATVDVLAATGTIALGRDAVSDRAALRVLSIGPAHGPLVHRYGFYRQAHDVTTTTNRVFARFVRAKSTQNVSKMEALVQAVSKPLWTASRLVFYAFDKPTKNMDPVALALSTAAQELLDAMASIEANGNSKAYFKAFGAKLRNLGKMLKAYVGKTTWAEMEPIITAQGTKSKVPAEKFREYEEILVGILKSTDTEVEGTFRHGGFNIALINTARGGDWDNERIGALRYIIDASGRALGKIGLGRVLYGTIVAYPAPKLPAAASLGHSTLASYNTVSDDIRLAVDTNPHEVVYSMVHELGHRAYFRMLSGEARKSWETFFHAMETAPDVDGIIAAWERYATGTESPDTDGKPDYWAVKYGAWSPYFFEHLRKTGQTELRMWLNIIMTKLKVKEEWDGMRDGPKRTKGNTPGLEQLKARKGEVKAFMLPITAYSTTSEEELFAEIVSALAVDGPGRIPELVLAEFKKAIPQVKIAAEEDR